MNDKTRITGLGGWEVWVLWGLVFFLSMQSRLTIDLLATPNCINGNGKRPIFGRGAIPSLLIRRKSFRKTLVVVVNFSKFHQQVLHYLIFRTPWFCSILITLNNINLYREKGWFTKIERLNRFSLALLIIKFQNI